MANAKSDTRYVFGSQTAFAEISKACGVRQGITYTNLLCKDPGQIAERLRDYAEEFPGEEVVPVE